MSNMSDFMSKDNNRADAIEQLINLCMEINLDYTYTDKHFTVTLPRFEDLPTAVDMNTNRRKSFDTSTWGDKGIDEDELPPIDKPLDEGETPEETKY